MRRAADAPFLYAPSGVCSTAGATLRVLSGGLGDEMRRIAKGRTAPKFRPWSLLQNSCGLKSFVVFGCVKRSF
jgi:hypothetical protein